MRGSVLLGLWDRDLSGRQMLNPGALAQIFLKVFKATKKGQIHFQFMD